MDEQVLVKVREICIGLPDVSERLSHGEPCWFYKGKRVICMFDDHHHGADRIAVWVPCLPGVAAELVGRNQSAEADPNLQSLPGKYFIPPYVGVKGWGGVILGEGTDWAELSGLVETAWEMVKAKK